MSAASKLKLSRKKAPLHLEPDSGAGLATYSLIRAVYMDKIDEARAILKANPDQLNSQEPFAGLTALHIAVFRQNERMVALLSDHPECDITLQDNFQRTAPDMLVYTANHAIFDTVMRRAYHDQERAWINEAFEDGRASGKIVPLRPDDRKT